MSSSEEAERKGWGREQKDPDAVLLALLITVALHLALFWMSPARAMLPGVEAARPEPIWIVFADPDPDPDPEMQEDMRFVMAPADIPEERPQPTPNFSDRFQVAAQPEEAPPDPDNNPMVAGDEAESNRIVQGDPFQDPVLQSPSAAAEAGESPQQQMQAAPVLAAQPPLAQAAEQPRLPAEEGPSMSEFPDPVDELFDEPTAEAPHLAENQSPEDGTGDAQFTLPAQVSADQGITPRPRMRVQRDTSFGPIRDATRGAIRVGNLAFDSEHSEFGEYWRRVAEVIEARWRNILFSTRAISYSGNRVTVEFFITREGNVEEVRILASDANRLAETISVDAITSEAPFFRWSPEMILSMGERTSARITFIY